MSTYIYYIHTYNIKLYEKYYSILNKAQINNNFFFLIHYYFK